MHAVAAPVLYVPAGHSVHVAAPELLNRPAGQGAAVALVDPTGQKYLDDPCRAMPPKCELERLQAINPHL
jgi:hypothetical protein